MHVLDGPRLKISRAISEINRLRLMESVFFKSTKYSIVRAEINPISGNRVYRIKIDGPPPSLDWGVYIGEIAHNLRSALDGMVYQLARLNTKAPARNTQFPIFLVGHTVKRKRGKRKGLIPHFEGMNLGDGRSMICNLTRKHQTFIKGLQPYKRKRITHLKTVDLTKWSGTDSPLFWLKEINNADKHRIIQVVGVRAGGFGTTHWGERNDIPIRGTFDILKDGAKFAEYPPDMYVNFHIRPLIAFTNCCRPIDRKPVYPLFDLIATTVSEIIESFASEFP